MSPSSYIPLPQIIAAKKAVINIQNEDNKCFLWSVLAGIHPTENNSHRVSSYVPFLNELNIDGIDFPTPLSQIDKFERLNQISINVFGWEKEIFPLHITRHNFDKHVNLLLIWDGEQSHFCLIKNLSRLLGNLTKHEHQSFYCPYCLHRFVNKSKLDSHIVDCKEHKEQKIKMPKENWLQFDKHHFQLPVPFVIYADLESILVKYDTCSPNPNSSNSVAIADHIPCGYSYVIIGPDGNIFKQPNVYHGENAIDNFLSNLLKEEEELLQIIRSNTPMIFTEEDEKKFKAAINCHICEKPLGTDRVRDHCHISGKFINAAHNNCNLKYKLATYIPVVIHNLKGYDSHLIIQGLGKLKNQNISIIPNNSEKFISFSIGSLRFLDSLQFLNASLEKLAENLEKEKFYLTRSIFDDKTDLMLRKGIYPYEYMDSFSRFEEKQLPNISHFQSSLSSMSISNENYEHALKVWEIFNLKNLGEYHDLYVLSDTLLLADIFQNFRKLSLNFYKLDPCHFYTSPGLAWQASLRMTGVKLELFTDPDMHLFVERGIRGGIAMISHRYSKANNIYMESYNPNESDKFIMYFDANNLYGWAMSQSLPTHGFKWSDEDIDFMNIPDDAAEGYILEVDLEYPDTLHDLHQDYPLAVENFNITPEMLSDFSKNLALQLNLKLTVSQKLTPNLFDKHRYVLHYRNLKQYVSLGMKVTKIHKVLKFNQSPWLQKYILFNTEQRKLAKSNFEKDLFKLLNNAVFGKTMENLRNRTKIDLVNDDKKAQKLIASPSFHAFKIITNDLVSIERKKITLLLNRPIYVGFSILDISKTLMYDFHYNFIKKKYGNNSKLLFTDTDSLCYEIQTRDFYEDIKNDMDLFDTSDYPQSHPLYSVKNKKSLGKMKDELSSKIGIEFVGLKAKMYSLKCEDIEKKTAKGVQKAIIKHEIKHLDYKNSLFNNHRGLGASYKIVSKAHKVQTALCRKITLCPFDNKRFILKDGIHTLPYGHYRIQKCIDL